jgi:hypothetical protein
MPSGLKKESGVNPEQAEAWRPVKRRSCVRQNRYRVRKARTSRDGVGESQPPGNPGRLSPGVEAKASEYASRENDYGRDWYEVTDAGGIPQAERFIPNKCVAEIRLWRLNEGSIAAAVLFFKYARQRQPDI